MARASGPGPASWQGLRWLASVGPSPIEVWRIGQGWSEPTAWSHSQRLLAAGLVERCWTGQRFGSLLYASRTAARMLRETEQLTVSPVASSPARTTWAHCVACAWTAAWLTARGRAMRGSRELLTDDGWRGELRWRERGESRRRSHRPDLAAAIRSGGSLVPIEVELAAKSKPRLRSVLSLYASWIAGGRAGGVIYVCLDDETRRRIAEEGESLGLRTTAHAGRHRTLRIELLSDLRQQAVEARPPRDLSTPAGSDQRR